MVDANERTDDASSVLAACGSPGIAGSGPGALESEVEVVIAKDVRVSEEFGGEKPVI